MEHNDVRPGRRSFLLGIGGAAVAGARASRSSARAGQDHGFRRRPVSASPPHPLSGAKWQRNDLEVSTELRKGKNGAELAVFVTAPQTRLTRIRLRCHGAFPAGSRFLGDAWERSYGDLEWRGLVGERLMPWYFLASNGAVTHGYGVKTGTASICHWQADAGGATLWLDVSNGGGGVELGERRLETGTVVFRRGQAGESTLGAARAFCRGWGYELIKHDFSTFDLTGR
jgi:alpha-galactosidase